MKISFSVPRRPVSVNAAYKRRNLANGGKGLMLSDEGRAFKSAVAMYAIGARLRSNWPRTGAAKVALDITTWNTRHDADAAIKLLQDALEGILYVKDSAVQTVTATKHSDGGKPRIDVTVEVIE